MNRETKITFVSNIYVLAPTGRHAGLRTRVSTRYSKKVRIGTNSQPQKITYLPTLFAGWCRRKSGDTSRLIRSMTIRNETRRGGDRLVPTFAEEA